MNHLLDTNTCSIYIITNNVREFQRVEGLHVENWV
jgi:predicted nucleic acid-binding protein